jgi:hypothetical protein
MFSESKEYQELVKISLSSHVWAEVFKREGAKSGKPSIQGSEINFQHRGTHPFWVEVMPAFSAAERYVWPENVSACGNRGIYFMPIWDAVKNPVDNNHSILSSVTSDNSMLRHAVPRQKFQVIPNSIH